MPMICILGIWGLSACQSSHSEGKDLYLTHCANCHSEDGTGLSELIPPLAAADYLDTHAQEIACIIRKGLKGKITVNGRIYENEMPANPKLSPVDINNIQNYIQNAWSKSAKKPFINLQTTQEQLKNCP
jgi:mono/diheme cytochrome c family protein